MSRTIFITATDTDAGKTYVTLDIIRQLRAQRLRARAIKPVACGINAHNRYDDLSLLLEAQQLVHEDDINRYRFPAAGAPALVANKTRPALKPEILQQWCRQQAETQDVLLIEGIGGLMVPLASGYLVYDWLQALQADEVWLVVRCRLGAINHMLLTLDKLQQGGQPPAHIILNAITPTEALYLPDMQQALGAVAGCGKIHTLRTGESLNVRDFFAEGEPS